MRHKYNAKKVMTPDGAFDSKKEYYRFCELKILEAAGEISELERQKEYELIPAQYEYVVDGKKIKRKCVERACKYVADFAYKQNDQTIVEDVKGYKKSQAYAVFTIKRKLMLEKYNIKIKEV